MGIATLLEMASAEMALGITAGSLLASIVHRARGVGLAFTVTVLTVIVLGWLQGGPDQLIAWGQEVGAFARRYEGVARGALIGAGAYFLYSIGYAAGHGAAHKEMRQD